MRHRGVTPITTKIGLKFCGGCDQRYDRVAAAERIREELKDLIELVPHDHPDVDTVLVIAGCDTACPDLEPFGNKRVRIMTSMEDCVEFIDSMKAKAGKART